MARLEGGVTSRVARAFWVDAPSIGALREEPVPAPAADQVLVRALFGAVSRGTETLVFRGGVPESERERMRCPHQVGNSPGPVKYGYSSVGRVLAGAPALVGARVFCLHPHQTEYVVEAGAVTILPDAVPAERAVLAANLETALNALWDARPLAGDRVSVVGAGVVGCLVAFLAAKIPGAEVELVDVRPQRAAVAAALGATFATPERAARGRDLVFHASGNPAGLETALELTSRDATVIELSWYGDRPVELSLGGAFHVERLTLRSSQVGTVSPNARRRFSHRERLALAVRLTADSALDVLFTEEGAFTDLPRTLARLADPDYDALCHRIRY